jgi:hypothetical protein
MMRLSPYLRKQFIDASKEAFAESELILFGSRIDDSKRGGDFDIAVYSNINREAFTKGKVRFFKYLILRDLDLPIDLVHYNLANDLLKQEIDKGIKL